MDTPKFSILIPVYNGEKTVARAIDSALGQTCGYFELLLIGALDIGQHLFDILKLENFDDRRTTSAEFQKYFGLSLTPAPYTPQFYPPGCGPQRYTYTFR